MTETIRPFTPAPVPIPDIADLVPPLPGYLAAESDRTISVRVGEGTWTFDRADVLSVDDRRDDETGEGRPVRVRIRPGATADFTQRRRIDLTDRPMTLPRRHSPAPGDDELRRLTDAWARALRLPDAPGVGGATSTFCQTMTSARSDDGTACDSLD
ncbi:hypothetical protein [Nocardia thraciensis]